MTPKRGGIYLASLNPSRGTEPGKTRPCLVIQSDLLCAAGHPSTAILPMTSRLLKDASPLRFTVASRDNLKLDSQVLMDLPRAIDNRRFRSDILTQLSESEMAAVEERLKIVLDLHN